jgi:MOSC domain-containing protein YiiM
MAGRTPVSVGNHEYTAQDAHKTVGSIADLWKAHMHLSTVPDGWLAGARGFVAEMASLAGVPLPALDDLDAAFASLDKSVNGKYDALDHAQVESLIAAMWRFYPTMRRLDHEHTGTVARMHASKGLPKKPVDGAEIGWKGAGGDVQTARAHHGRPWQALCIWTTDSIERLQAEGHPIAPGYAGENLTVAGIPNAAMRPGAQFRAGTVRGFLTDYAWPCSQNNDWFLGNDFMRMCHERGDDSRVYAMVTRPGTINVGDPFELFTDR